MSSTVIEKAAPRGRKRSQAPATGSRGRVEAANQELHPYARFARFAVRIVPEKGRPDATAQSYEKSSEGFLKAIQFSRLNVTPLEVEMAAYVGCILFLIAGMAVGAVVSIVVLGFDVVQFALYVALPIGVLSLLTLQFLAKFPEMHAKTMRARTAGQMPEAISYLALSMQLNPSLTRAVAFAADHTQEPIAGSLRQVLWKVYTREHARVEDAFVDFAYEWGDWNEDFKKALYTVRAAEMEGSQEGREATLDKATTSMYKGARATVEDFAMSLGGPSTVFFATGIILPMMIGSMLPLMSLGGSSVSPAFIVFLFDVLFPVFTFGYSYFILQKRPGTSPPPQMDTRLTPREKASAAVGVLLAFSIPLGVGIFALNTPALGWIGYLPFLWAAALPVAVYAYVTSKRAKRERDRVRILEQEYPDALYQLGSRMGEGHPVEQALEQTSSAMRGTEIAKLLRLTTYRLQVMRGSLQDTLFGPDGVLTRQPSRVIQNTMKVVVGATTKEPRTAGRTIVSISAYLREMLAVEREIRNRLKEVTDTMLTTGTFFAPVVLGVTGALNLIITDTLGGIDLDESAAAAIGFSFSGSAEGAAAALSPAAFSLVVGIYLVLTVLVTSFFVSGIRHGQDRIELKWTIGNGLPVALVVYTGATILVQNTLA